MISTKSRVPESTGRRAVKVLFLASNPGSTERLRLDREARRIRERLLSATHSDGVQIVSRWAVRFDDLLEALLEVQPDIVHFSGHGTHARQILLEDEGGSEAPVSSHALAGLFGILKDRICLVVLNACYSRCQAEALNEHIDCTVGMGLSVSDEAAVEFAATFYQAIGFGRSVQTAFDLACNVLRCKRIPGSDIPELFVRPGVDPRDVVLVGEHADLGVFNPGRVSSPDGVGGAPRPIESPPADAEAARIREGGAGYRDGLPPVSRGVVPAPPWSLKGIWFGGGLVLLCLAAFTRIALRGATPALTGAAAIGTQEAPLIAEPSKTEGAATGEPTAPAAVAMTVPTLLIASDPPGTPAPHTPASRRGTGPRRKGATAEPAMSELKPTGDGPAPGSSAPAPAAPATTPPAQDPAAQPEPANDYDVR